MQYTQQHFYYVLLTSYCASKLIKRHFLKTQPQIFEAKNDVRGGAEALWLINMRMTARVLSLVSRTIQYKQAPCIPHPKLPKMKLYWWPLCRFQLGLSDHLASSQNAQ